MDTEKILSKLGARDYHKEIEDILEGKDFSEDVKNLLLSCVYKIETGYEDYAMVKRLVESKKDYLEEIMKILQQRCTHIEIITTGQDNFEKIQRKYEVDKLEGTIKLWHPNESTLLYAIYELNDESIYVDEKYSELRVALCNLLNQGENINHLEVLRDFNGWNWNTGSKEIKDITINCIYQDFIYLLGLDFLKQWLHTEELKDYLEIAKQKLEQLYGKEITNDIFRLIDPLALIIMRREQSKGKRKIISRKTRVTKRTR